MPGYKYNYMNYSPVNYLRNNFVDHGTCHCNYKNICDGRFAGGNTLCCFGILNWFIIHNVFFIRWYGKLICAFPDVRDCIFIKIHRRPIACPICFEQLTLSMSCMLKGLDSGFRGSLEGDMQSDPKVTLSDFFGLKSHFGDHFGGEPESHFLIPA